MVAYSFKKRFVEPIRTGVKPHTIRAYRRRHARPGEEIQAYCGMRTKWCFLIARPMCSRVGSIEIDLGGLVTIDRSEVIEDRAELDFFSIKDGFVSWDDMVTFWRKNHPGVHWFKGVIIFWHPLEPRSP